MSTEDVNREALVRCSAWLGKSGFSALREWDATFKHHHLPMWAKKRIRLWAIECGTWHAGMTTHQECLPREVFDHWGSIVRGGVRAVYAMPYNEPDALAGVWAGIMDCTLETLAPGPWNEGTTCYVFLPNAFDVATKPAPESTEQP